MGLVKSTIFEIVALDQLQSATTTLRENAEYLSEDKRSNGWLKSPLNHYLHFAETALCNSCHTVLPQPPTKLAKPKPHEQVQPSSPEIPASTNHTTKLAKKEPYTAYPKRELFAALAEDRIPDEDFNQLLTLDGTRALLGMTPRHNTPVFALVHQPFFWGDPATRRGKTVFVTAQWFERDKARLDKLLARWRNKENSVTPSGVQIAVNGIESRLAELLEAEFANGFRPRDFIDQMKFRKLFLQWFDEELPNDFDLASALPSLGFEHDGKVFPKLSAKGKWRKIVDRLLADDHGIFSFKVVMEREAGALMQAGIRSAEILRRTLLETCADAYEIGEAFFAPKGRTANLVEAVASATAEESVIAAGTLASRFQFVDESDIRDALKADKDLIWNQGDTYARLSRIAFDDDEAECAVRLCGREVSENGFIPLTQLDLSTSAALNPPSLETGTLRRVFFRRYLADDYDLHGGVIIAKGREADALLPLRAFCRSNATVSLAQAEALAKECGIPLWRTISALHEEMVRVDGDTFVSPRTIAFDVPGTDAAIRGFCPGDVAPLGAIASFSDFPAVPGHAWSLFLLEGYLRRASADFMLHTASAGTKDVCGVVVRRGAGLNDWRDVFARAALEAGVEPDAEAVGDFLVAQRGILRRRVEMLIEIAARMGGMKGAK